MALARSNSGCGYTKMTMQPIVVMQRAINDGSGASFISELDDVSLSEKKARNGMGNR